MLDKWLADMAEDGMEKTASDQFGEALDQLSAEELKAIYDLQGEKIKEASWAGRAAGGLLGAAGGAGLGGAVGAGLGGAAGSLYAPPDRHMEGFWQGARRGAALGAGIGGVGGAIGGAGAGGALTGGGKGDVAAMLGGGGLAQLGAPTAASVGGGMAGAGVDPEQPVIVVERQKRSKKKGKEKKSYDLAAMEKDAGWGEFLRKNRGKIKERAARVLTQAGDKIDPRPRRKRMAATAAGLLGAVGVGYGVGRVSGRAKEKKASLKSTLTKKLRKTWLRGKVGKRLRDVAEKVDPQRRKRIAAVAAGMAGAGALGAAGGYHYSKKGKKNQASLLKEAAKRGLMRRMVEGVGGIGLGKQRKEVQETVLSTSRDLGRKKRLARKYLIPKEVAETSGVGRTRSEMQSAMKERSDLRNRAFGRGVKALGATGGAAGLAGLGYGGYRLGRRGNEK